MANPLSYRVCGECAANHSNPITDLFKDTFFKCKLCNKSYRDGCYMLFTHDAKEHYVRKPIMFIGDRRTGKTTWLLNKINEYETITGPRFYVIAGYGKNHAMDIATGIVFSSGFTKNEHFKILTPDDIMRRFEGIDSDSNVYVDEVQQLNHQEILMLSELVASGKCSHLFTTRTKTPIDLLQGHSHVYLASEQSQNLKN